MNSTTNQYLQHKDPASTCDVVQFVFVLLDGLGDVGCRTPLQQAETPWLDRMVQQGPSGLMDPVEPGLACGSDTAHLSLFGYDLREYYRGRGAFETMGAGLEMRAGDIAFKSNFAVLLHGEQPYDAQCYDLDQCKKAMPMVLSRRADRAFEREGPLLCAALDGLQIPGYPDHQVAVKYATEHRCGVRIRGPRLSDRITGTDPLKDHRALLRCQPDPQLDRTDTEYANALLTSNLVNALSLHMHRLLTTHPVNIERTKQGKPPANVVLLRGCGMALDVPPLTQRHPWMFQPSSRFSSGDEDQQTHQYGAFAIAPTCIINGLAQTLGMTVLPNPPGATGDYRTNLRSKALAALDALHNSTGLTPRYTFGFVHVKAIDDAGHDGRADWKKEWIERADRDLIGAIFTEHWRWLDEQHTNDGSMKDRLIVVVTGDHSTPVALGDHSHEPVPFVLCASHQLRSAYCDEEDISHTRQDQEEQQDCKFDELLAGAGGTLGRFPGSECFTVLQRYRTWMEEQGQHSTRGRPAANR